MTTKDIEEIVAKYTKLIHPQDLGEPTSKLENTLREAFEELTTLTKAVEEARREEREAWLKGNRCAVCGDSNIGSGGLSDLCSNCVETQ